MISPSLISSLTQSLAHHTQIKIPRGALGEMHQWSLFPPGKLFRPLLVKATNSDLVGSSLESPWERGNPQAIYASALEVHHAYTLVHDDLPSMDNSPERRGKASSHRKYGVANALLVGDGLQNLSFSLFAKIQSPQLSALLNYFSWATGPKGLIFGQYLDLNPPHPVDFPHILITHKLKTARLIQAALVGSYLLSLSAPDQFRWSTAKFYHRLGERIGMVFQFLDDLTESGDAVDHEREINSFVNFPQKSGPYLKRQLLALEHDLRQPKLANLKKVLTHYLSFPRKKLQDLELPDSKEILDLLCQI